MTHQRETPRWRPIARPGEVDYMTAPASSATTTSARVLVVDDDRALRAALQRLLRAEGFEVWTAANGREALEFFREGIAPDVVLLDVVMPEVDGFEVCKRLKQDPETRLTPVVMLTGLHAVEDRVRGIEAGADDLLTKPFERTELLARVRSLVRLKSYTDELERAESVVFALALSIEGKDPYTQGHCERLSRLAGRLGARVGLPEDSVVALERGGIVHDLGKIAVPDAILLKPGRLTQEDWAILREHPVKGEEICSGLKSFQQVLPIIRHHHEKRDGSGYPDGLAGDDVPMTARVLQVVDVYDALTTERPYKRALGHVEALGVMQEEVERGWWDPNVYDAFRDMSAEGLRT